MKLVNYQPVSTGHLDHFIDNFFNRGLNGFVGSDHFASQPLVNIFESKVDYVLEIAAPGLDKSDFDVKIEGDALTVSAHQAHRTDGQASEKLLRKEYAYTTFSRTFRLPENVEFEKIKAVYENGVLKLSIPKSETEVQKYRTIEIR